MSNPVVRLILVAALIVISSGIVFQPTAYAQAEIERVGPGGPPAPGTGPVDTTSFVRVIDGNTVDTWLAGSRAGIGIIGIDAPAANTACGRESANYLQNLVYGGLHFEEDLDITYNSAHMRMYYAFLPGGESVAAAMVSAGMASPSGEGYETGDLRTLEDEARAAKLGCINNAEDTSLRSDPDSASALEPVQPLQATVLPDGFILDRVVSGLNFPTSFSILPDGRILVGEKSGVISLYKDGALLPTPFIDISAQVNDYWDRGLLKVAADPNFETNGYVYLLYTYENDPANFDGTKTARLLRVTAQGDTASLSTAQILLGTIVGETCVSGTDCIPSESPGHSAGGISFGADGALFVTLGDGAGFNVVEDDALRAQDLDSLAGKILRIDSNGAGVPSNPFWDGDPNSNRSKVWALGLRNAYRLTVRPQTGIPYLGDVGWNTWEEVNVVPAGANLGWPCFEGPARQGGYEPMAVCQSLYDQGSAAVQTPLVSWDRVGRGSAVTGGVFIDSDLYPAWLRGAYVYADYVGGSIHYIHVDENDALTEGPLSLAEDADGPVDFAFGPDGYLYYLAINTGEIRRIRSTLVEPQPGDDVFLSDLPWVSMTNGWGPAERNQSNGEDEPGDGNIISLNGTPYDKGLGTHSNSELRYDITGHCTVFSAVIGIDDESRPQGSVTFEVWGDDTRLYVSGRHTGQTIPEEIIVDLAGYSELRLVVNNGGDNIDNDHADWANARLSCSLAPPPPPPQPDPNMVFVSDLEWVSMTNGWGPAERNRSNGEDGADDGNVMSLAGVAYTKGLGVHADSEIRYNIDGLCTTFSAVIGIDDEVRPNGRVQFEVWGDDVRLYQSGLHSGSIDPEPITVDLTGHNELRLVVTDGGDGVGYDHADWADAALTCPAAPDETPPEILSQNPPDGAAGIALTSAVEATFSEAMDAASISAANMTLEGPDGPVAASVSYIPDTRQAELVLEDALSAGTIYTARVRGGIVGVTDTAGNPLASDVTWSFTTAEAAQLPTASITSPSATLLYATGDEITYAGTGADSEGNPLPASSLSWRILIHHCSESDCHIHQLLDETGVAGGSFVAPDHGIDAWRIEIQLTVTAGDGAEVTSSVEVFPRTVTVTLESSPPGLNVSFGSVNGAAPLSRDIVVGSQITIQAPAQQGGMVFQSWSDGGEQQHNVTVGDADTTFVATFVENVPPPAGEEVYVSDLPWISMTNGWGPAELDRSNGEEGSADGNVLTLNGTTYAKGLGVHAASEIRYDLAGLCTVFTAVLGIDDEVGSRGSVRFEIWGDDVRLYQSGVHQGSTAAEPVQVDLSGYSELRLVVNDAGDNNGYDHANWADARLSCDVEPPPPPDPDALYVSDLTWVSMINEWGPVERDRSNGEEGLADGNPITLNGAVYTKGLGVHAPSDILYDIGGLCSIFSAVIGIDDEVGSFGSVRFEVWGDTTRLYQSGILTGSSLPETIAVDLTGYSELRLIVTDAGDNVFYDHVDWADARLACSTTPDPPPPPPPEPDGLFAPVTTYATGTHSHGVVAADVTGDGQLDLVVANAGDSSVSVLPGNGDGTFAAGSSWDVGGFTPKMAVVGDVNNDTIPDIITANQDSSGIGILLGTGAGQFAAATELPTCSVVHEVAVDDLDLDGNLDIVTSCPGGGVVGVRLGNGDGTFGDSVQYSVGSKPNSLVIADLNGDNIPDIAAANYFGSSVAVLLGNGDGTFVPAVSYGVDAGPHSVRSGDLNGDGHLDLVTANDMAGTVSILIGNGDGTFGPELVYAVNPGPKSVGLGDINGDGRLDIVVANSWGNYEASRPVPTDISVLLGIEDGSFAEAQFYPIDLTPFSIAIADFNGDGRADVATALWHSNNVGVFLNITE